MDQGTAQTVREIEAVRDRIGSNLDELEERIPRPARMAKRAAGVALGGGAGGTIVWFAVRRIRNRRKAQPRMPDVVVNVLPERLTKRMEQTLADGTWRPWAAGVGAAWFLMRMAELRQLRRMRRAMV